jgi:hypothetical protein
VANPHKAFGQDVQQKAPNELVGVESHLTRLIGAAIVSPTKSDLAAVETQQPMIGNRHSMSVAPEVIKYLSGPAKRPLGVDHPIDAPKRIEKFDECLFVRQLFERRVRLELALLECLIEIMKEQPAKQPRQHSYWKKEVGAASDPPAAAGGQAATGNYAMQVRVMEKILTPGVQHRQEADLGAEVLGVLGYPPQGLARGAEQDIVNHSLVVKRKLRELIGNGKHHVKVVDRQKLGPLLVQPLGLGQRLTLGAVAITARVVRHTSMSAPVALISVAAKPRSATLLDCSHHAVLL